MKTLNFGIVGAGLIADFHARALGDIGNVKLVGFFDSVGAKAQELAEKYSVMAYSSLDEMLADDGIDAITIATPSGAHMEAAVAAAKAGKHVICEKPLEVTLERVDAMIDAHEQSETVLGGIFQNRFNECMLPLRKAIEGGRFGVITYVGVYVPWYRKDEYYDGSWHGTWKLDGGGALMNQSIHMIDMLCDLLGKPESVMAYMNNAGHPQIEAEDTATAVMRFGNGTLGVVYGTTSEYPGRFKRFEIAGTKGTVVYLEDSFTTWEFAEAKDEDEEIRSKFGQVQSGGGVADPAAIDYKNHTLNFKAFIDAIEGKGGACVGGDEAKKAVEVILAIYESAREGKIVKL